MDGRFIVPALRDVACVVFGLSGFPLRKENGLLYSRTSRKKQNN